MHCIDIGIGEEWYGIASGIISFRPGTVARSEVRSLGMQAAPSSIPTSGTFFCGDLVMKTFPLALIQEEQLSVTGERMCTKYW